MTPQTPKHWAYYCLTAAVFLISVSHSKAQVPVSQFDPGSNILTAPDDMGIMGVIPDEFLEQKWLRKFRENLRLTLDVSMRPVFRSHQANDFVMQFYGIDMLKVFSGDNGDWGRLLFQGYLTHIDDMNPHPPFFEGPNDWEMVYRIFDFNYTGLSDGRLNFKIGHFEVPFGLEHPLNTNGTLRDFIHPRNLGVKADWGISINGVLPEFEYEFSWQRGTGIEYFDHDSPYVVAGRVGTPQENNLVFGASVFHGRVFSPAAVGTYLSGATGATASMFPGRVIRRSRIGVDAQWYFSESLAVMTDISFGQDVDQNVVNALVEIDWHSPEEQWFVYEQWQFFNQRFDSGWKDAVALAHGVRYTPDNHWAFSVQYTQNISVFNGRSNVAVIGLQARYRF